MLKAGVLLFIAFPAIHANTFFSPCPVTSSPSGVAIGPTTAGCVRSGAGYIPVICNVPANTVPGLTNGTAFPVKLNSSWTGPYDCKHINGLFVCNSCTTYIPLQSVSLNNALQTASDLLTLYDFSTPPTCTTNDAIAALLGASPPYVTEAELNTLPVTGYYHSGTSAVCAAFPECEFAFGRCSSGCLTCGGSFTVGINADCFIPATVQKAGGDDAGGNGILVSIGPAMSPQRLFYRAFAAVASTTDITLPESPAFTQGIVEIANRCNVTTLRQPHRQGISTSSTTARRHLMTQYKNLSAYTTAANELLYASTYIRGDVCDLIPAAGAWDRFLYDAQSQPSSIVLRGKYYPPGNSSCQGLCLNNYNLLSTTTIQGAVACNAGCLRCGGQTIGLQSATGILGTYSNTAVQAEVNINAVGQLMKKPIQPAHASFSGQNGLYLANSNYVPPKYTKTADK